MLKKKKKNTENHRIKIKKEKKNATPAAIRTKSNMILPVAWKSKVFYLNKI